MTVSPLDVVKVTAVFTYDDVSDIINVFHYQNQGSSAVSDEDVLEDLVGELDGYYGALTSTWSSKIKPVRVELYNVTADMPIGSTPWPTLSDGESALESLPLQCSPLVSFPTGFPKAIGRKYLPPVDEAHNSHGGTLTAALLADMVAWAAAVIDGVTISGSIFKAGHVQKIGGAFVTWIASEIDSRIRTQRRRVVGVGE